ncbi:hypothetical protein NMG60_11012897 [Bertholletia excelsa]
MDASKSNTTSEGDDLFVDAPDEFPFYDCSSGDEPDQSISISPPVTQLESSAVASVNSKPSPEISSPTGLRRRRSVAQPSRGDACSSHSKISIPISSVSSDSATPATPAKRKYDFSGNPKLKERESETSDLSQVRLRLKGEGHGASKDSTEVSTVTTANHYSYSAAIRGTSTVTTANHSSPSVAVREDMRSGEGVESSAKFVFFLAGLVVNAIGFQISLLVSFFSFPVWFVYFSYLFVVDPFQVFRRGKEYLILKSLRIWSTLSAGFMPFVNEWLKEQKLVWKLVWRFVWGSLWATYVCVVLISLLMSAFVVSGLIMKILVEEPMQMKEPLTLDYTNSSPAAFVPLISCAGVSCLHCEERNGFGARFGPRVIPAKYKLKATVSLTLPESDYNRNLGIFQVRVDFLSARGRILSSSKRPCMMIFKSQPLRFLLSFLNAAPLLAGYSTESQSLHIKFSGFTEGDVPTACVRVMLEPRAQFQHGAGLPEIYEASLLLESELPLLRRIVWYWKKTLFIWIGMTTFTVELVFALLCCRPAVMPRVRVRRGSANNAS